MIPANREDRDVPEEVDRSTGIGVAVRPSAGERRPRIDYSALKMHKRV